MPTGLYGQSLRTIIAKLSVYHLWITLVYVSLSPACWYLINYCTFTFGEYSLLGTARAMNKNILFSPTQSTVTLELICDKQHTATTLTLKVHLRESTDHLRMKYTFKTQQLGDSTPSAERHPKATSLPIRLNGPLRVPIVMLFSLSARALSRHQPLLLVLLLSAAARYLSLHAHYRFSNYVSAMTKTST